MKTAFFISWRYQRGRQKNRLVSLISLFSTVGITLGVAVLILGLSAMNGFERELNNRVLAVVPHGEILPYNPDGKNDRLKHYSTLSQQLQTSPQIKGVSPFVSFTALVEKGSKLKVVQVKGVDKSQLDQVSALGQFVLNNAWADFNRESGLILGYGIAQQLGVKQGDWVTLLISPPNSGTQLVQPLRQRIQISGILRLDGQLDYSYALMPLQLAQQWLDYQADQVSGVEFAVTSPFLVQQLDYAMLANYPQKLIAQTWISKFGYMYRDISLIRTVMYIAMVLVVGVACFNIISTLIMAVKDKQSDIAILRTLGADNRFIKRIFIWYGLQAGMKGCLMGALLGVLLSLNLTNLIKGIETIIGHKLLSDGIYFVDFMPSELHGQDVLLVLLVALVLSLVASIYPANRAAKLQPAQVLSNY